MKKSIILITLLFATTVQMITAEQSALSFIFSTNTCHTHFSYVDAFLTDRESLVEQGVNPNGGRTIKFWYINKEDITA